MANTNKGKDMTTREFIVNVMNGTLDAKSSNGQTIMEKAQVMLDAIDKRNEANKARPKKSKTVDNTEYKEAIITYLNTLAESVTGKDIAESLEITTPKATAVLKQLIAEGKVERLDLGRNKPLEYKIL